MLRSSGPLFYRFTKLNNPMKLALYKSVLATGQFVVLHVQKNKNKNLCVKFFVLGVLYASSSYSFLFARFVVNLHKVQVVVLVYSRYKLIKLWNGIKNNSLIASLFFERTKSFEHTFFIWPCVVCSAWIEKRITSLPSCKRQTYTSSSNVFSV